MTLQETNRNKMILDLQTALQNKYLAHRVPLETLDMTPLRPERLVPLADISKRLFLRDDLQCGQHLVKGHQSLIDIIPNFTLTGQILVQHSSLYQLLRHYLLKAL